MKAKVWFVLAASAVVLACVSIDQITSRRVMVATLLGTPRVEVSPAGFADAGVSAPDGGYALEEQTVAIAFLGELARESLDDPPEPLEGASFKVVRVSANAGVALEDQGGGQYRATSADNATLKYVSGDDYRFEATIQGESEALRAEVTDVPLQESITEFHPSSGIILHDANTAFTFTRPAPPAGIERPFGFVTVFPVGGDGTKGQPTYTNIPVDFLGLLKMVVNPNAFKQTQVTIPASAFPASGSNYVIVFQAAKLGRATSDNLSAFSAILAGVADVGAVRTR